MKKLLLFLCFNFLLVSKVYATPNNTMSISPSATDNTVISADDENARNSEISSKYNAHGHTEIALTGDTAYMRFDDTYSKWVISSDTGATGISIHSNTVYIHGNSTKLIMTSPDGTCSSCGVDNSDSWTCASTTCPN